MSMTTGSRSASERQDSTTCPPPTNIPSNVAFITTLRADARLGTLVKIPLIDGHYARMSKSWNEWTNISVGSPVEESSTSRNALHLGSKEELQRDILQLVEQRSSDANKDWRIRINASLQEITLDIEPMPVGSPPFLWELDQAPEKVHHIAFDLVRLERGRQADSYWYMHKTNQRAHYTAALARTKEAAARAGLPPLFEVILHWAHDKESSTEQDLVSEMTFSNLVIHVPGTDKHGTTTEWVTPRLSAANPGLNGLMRQWLMDHEHVREMDVTVENVTAWAKQGRRMMGCNALRGVFEVRLVEIPKESE